MVRIDRGAVEAEGLDETLQLPYDRVFSPIPGSTSEYPYVTPTDFHDYRINILGHTLLYNEKYKYNSLMIYH